MTQLWSLRRTLFVAGPVAALALALIPSSLHGVSGYGSRPAYAAAVALWMALWWLSEAVSFTWTSLLPLLLFPLLQVLGPGITHNVQQTAAAYVDPYIFLFLGGMLLGAAMERWDLHRRIALHIMHRVGTSPHRLLWGMMFATAIISAWLSNTATTVMMLPIAQAILAQLRQPQITPTSAVSVVFSPSGTSSALLLAIAYASNIGGIATKIGTATNSIFVGFAASHLHRDIGFIEYMLIGTPFVLLLLPIATLMLTRLLPTHASTLPDNYLQQTLLSLGAMSKNERRIAWLFGTTALLWVTGDILRPLANTVLASLNVSTSLRGKDYEAIVAMMGGLSVLAFRLLDWEALRRIPWSALVLLGGSFAMATGLENGGFSAWVEPYLQTLTHLPLGWQLLLTSSATIALSAFASNTATINLMLNLLPKKIPLLSASTIAASCDFALPAGTPPNAIVFATGQVRLSTMLKTGVVLDLFAALVITVYIWGLTTIGLLS